MCHPGSVENIILVIDCEGIGLFNMDFGLYKEVMSTITTFYKCKIKSIFCLNCSVTFPFLLGACRYSMDNKMIMKTEWSKTAISEKLLSISHAS
jgi:hypothetical protein